MVDFRNRSFRKKGGGQAPMIYPGGGYVLFKVDRLEWWTPLWTPTKKRLRPQRHNLLICLERATGIEPATLGLGSLGQ